MEFKIGYTIKPQEITDLNEVTFVSSSGVKPAPYTESDCLAYGFRYINSKCFTTANDLDLIPDRSNNGISSSRSNIGATAYNNTIIGDDNILSNNTNNNLISGRNNTIDYFVSNSILNGTKGESKYTNAQVLGGNERDDILGERQSIVVLCGAETTNNASTATYINNDGSTLFNVEDNSIVYYAAHVIGVRTGGSDSSGAKGDFKSFIERGCVVSRGGTLTLKRTRDNIVSDGTTTGWLSSSDTSGTNLRILVKGKNNMDIKWIVKLEISEMRTGIDLS